MIYSFFLKNISEKEVQFLKHQLYINYYLSKVFKKHVDALKLIFDSNPICIIMDESSDDCARSVVNTIFTYHADTKLVKSQNVLYGFLA